MLKCTPKTFVFVHCYAACTNTANIVLKKNKKYPVRVPEGENYEYVVVVENRRLHGNLNFLFQSCSCCCLLYNVFKDLSEKKEPFFSTKNE